MEDEKNLQLDKPGKGKSVEQIKKHTIDINFDNKPIDRGMYILANGDDIQKLSIIQTLPQLAQIDAQSTHSRIIPKIIQDLPRSSSDFQVTASRVFKVLIQSNVPINLMGSVTQGIESKDANVSNAWCDTLLDVIQYLPDETINSVVLPLAKLKSRHNETTNSKVLSCKVLANICLHPKLKTVDIKKDVVPPVLSLCQDVSDDVRATMGAYLPNIAKGLGAELVRTSLLPTLVELASDKSGLVRGATIPSVSAMLKYLDPATKKQAMIPLLKQLCEQAMAKEDTTAALLANEFSNLLDELQKSVTLAEAQYFLKCFKTISQRGKSTNYNDVYSVDNTKEVICRDRVASNLPGIIEFTMKSAPEELPMVYSIFRELAADSCYIVRRTIAGTLADMSRILGAENKMMRNDIVRILRDDAEEVLLLLVPTLSSTLLNLCQYGALSNKASTQVTMDIGRALFKCQMEICKGYNWRLMVTFLQQLESLPLCMPSDFLHNHFTPMILDKALNGRARPIRVQCIRTILIFLRHYTKETQQKWLRDSLILQISQSENAYTRVLYPVLCEQCLQIFSEKYFKEYFLQPLLSLSVDKVANVRYALALISTKIKQLATFGVDLKTKELVYETILKMEQVEKCKFVLDLLRKRKKDPILKRNEERLLEEEQRLQEELTGVHRHPQQQKTTLPALNQSGSNTPQKIAPVLSSDMKFLQQHFYTDAGMTLAPPTLPTPPEDDTTSEETSPDTATSALSTHFNKLSVTDASALTNITDDVKVNLRMISSQPPHTPPTSKSKLVQPKTYHYKETDTQPPSQPPPRNKRYSSIFSTACLVDARKALNRRSLHVLMPMPPQRGSGSTSSRIPVVMVLKSEKTDDAAAHAFINEADADDIMADLTVNHRLKSNLPVYIKKPYTKPTAPKK